VLDVPLVLEEPAGVARQGEPMLCGVPLPKGICHDPNELCLVDERGGMVPAVFTAANRWWDDGSVKWVHVDLQRSLAAKGMATLRLRLAEAQPAPPAGLEVEETGSSITVTTGPLRFRVRKRGFNLLDQVWLDESGRGAFDDEHAMLADRPRGFRVRDGQRTAWASADPDCRVEVEERNALRVVIRAEGRHRAEDGSPLTDFITRIIAYRGKPYVRVSHVFLVRQGESMAEYLPVQDVALVLPLRLEPGDDGLRYRFGGSEETHAGVLARKETASLHQYAPGGYVVYEADNENWWDSWRLGGSAEGSGHTLRTGWVDLADESRGIAVGVRNFWQLYPKVLEARADGEVVVGLYPDVRYNDPLLLYPGMARTHELTISFHGATDEGAVYDLMAASQAPLMLVAPAKWYCRDTLALGYLPEADPSIYDARYAEVVETFEGRFWSSFQHILERRDTRNGLPPGVEEYGIINFGDGFHYYQHATTYWDDNYYDFPHALILQFARTGRREYLDAAREYARHLGDIDTVCYEIDPGLVGGPRVCPAIDHVRAYYNGQPQTSLSFNFYKNQSLFEMWYLTGDRRFLEAALLSASFVLTQDGIGLSEPRSAGHAYIALRAAWEATGERKYLDRGHALWGRVAEFQDEHDGGFPHDWSFQVGLVTEGLRDWYILTGDREVLDRIRRAVDWMLETYGDPEKGFKDASAYPGFAGLGIAWEMTGDERYLDAALRHAKHYLATPYGSKVKDYGMAFRSSPYFLWWLQKDALPTCGPGDAD
jgi:hypothetical protein